MWIKCEGMAKEADRGLQFTRACQFLGLLEHAWMEGKLWAGAFVRNATANELAPFM